VDLDLVIEELKRQYPELYRTEFTTGAVFIWRPLSYYEYNVIYYDDKFEISDKEHAFCDICVLFSIVNGIEYHHGAYDFSRGLAGYPEKLTEQILSISGFADDDVAENMYNDSREQMDIWENQIPCIIKMAFGDEFKFDEILTWSLRRQLYYLSRAEWMLQTQGLLYGGRADLSRVQVKTRQEKPKPKPDRETWMAIENWEPMSEQEFLLKYAKESNYESEQDPNLFNV
jgi:hypothetical protein